MWSTTLLKLSTNMAINILNSVITYLDKAEITISKLREFDSYIFSPFFLIFLLTAFIVWLSAKVLLIQISKVFSFILES